MSFLGSRGTQKNEMKSKLTTYWHILLTENLLHGLNFELPQTNKGKKHENYNVEPFGGSPIQIDKSLVGYSLK